MNNEDLHSDERLPRVLRRKNFDYELIKDFFTFKRREDGLDIVEIKVTDECSYFITTRGEGWGVARHFHGDFTNECWSPPNQTLNNGDTVYVVTTILGAWILLHLKKKVIATLSAENLPENYILQNANRKIHWQFCADKRAFYSISRKYGLYKRTKYMDEIANLYIGEWNDWTKIDKQYLRDAYLQGKKFCKAVDEVQK